LILSMARAAGEVAPLMLTGVVKLAPSLPVDGSWPFLHFDRKFMHLGFHIYDVGFQSPNVEAAKPMVYITTLVLITVVVVLNLTPVSHATYRIGAPQAGRYRLVLNTDDVQFDGTGFEAAAELATEDEPQHGFPQSLTLRLPPLSALVFAPVAAAQSTTKNAAKKAPVKKAAAKKAAVKKATAKAAPKRKVASSKA